MTKSLLTIALSCALFSVNASADALSSAEITALFAGNTAACIKTKDDSKCETFMGAEGSVKRLTHSDGKTRLGTWHATDNQLCILWANKTKDLCFDIHKNADNSYNLDRKGKTKSVISGFVKGDTL